MLEQLRIVLEAEAEARRRLEAAREAARQLVAAAEADARRGAEETEAGQDQVVHAVEEHWIQEARQKAEAVENDVRVRVQAMLEHAEPRLAHAVETLVRRVLGTERGDGQ